MKGPQILFLPHAGKRPIVERWPELLDVTNFRVGRRERLKRASVDWSETPKWWRTWTPAAVVTPEDEANPDSGQRFVFEEDAEALLRVACDDAIRAWLCDNSFHTHIVADWMRITQKWTWKFANEALHAIADAEGKP